MTRIKATRTMLLWDSLGDFIKITVSPYIPLRVPCLELAAAPMLMPAFVPIGAVEGDMPATINESSARTISR
jgi:hypothetical protein